MPSLSATITVCHAWQDLYSRLTALAESRKSGCRFAASLMQYVNRGCMLTPRQANTATEMVGEAESPTILVGQTLARPSDMFTFTVALVAVTGEYRAYLIHTKAPEGALLRATADREEAVEAFRVARQSMLDAGYAPTESAGTEPHILEEN